VLIAPTPRRTPPLRRVPRTVLGLAVAVATLSGCAGLQPGAAVVVDDRVVTEDRVDLATEALCEYFAPQLEQAQQSVPLLEVRRAAATLLALRSATEQVAEAYDATPTRDYNRELTRLEEQAETLPDDLQEAFLEVQGAQVYVPTVLSEIGAAALAADGAAGATGADLTTTTVAGLQVLAEFLRENEVEFAPGLGLAVEVGEVPDSPTPEEVNALIGGFFVRADSSASVPVTELATATAGDPAADQRCG
jgi:hypothetical protein